MSYEKTPTTESFPKISEGMTANMLQIQLMPLAYGLLHSTEPANMKDPEVRKVVTAEWVEYFAQPFREYIEDHPRETIDIGNTEAVKEFFAHFLEASGVTIH
jgi:hypothetical protein